MPLKTVEIPLGEFLPDSPDYKNPGCIVADNCYPAPGGAYTPFAGASAQGDEIDEVVVGAAQFFKNDGTTVIVGGTSTKLLHLAGGTLTATTGYTAIGSGEFWDFAQFNARVIATAPNNSPQYLTDIASDTGWSALPGSPPEAKYCKRIGNWLMLANLSGLGLPMSIQTSAENDPTDWPTPGTTDARLKRSGRVTIQQEHGPITRLAGDRYPMVFQERAISRIDTVQPPLNLRIEPIEEARGCIAPASVVTVGFVTYFLAHDGFWATDGNQVFPIGNQRVNDWFFDNVSETDRSVTHGAVSWERQCVVWAFYPESDPTGYKRLIIYSWRDNRWSTATLSLDWLVDNKVAATTVEDLDAINSDLDALTPSLDDRFWSARSRVLSCFKQDGSGNSEMHLLNGDPLEAIWETGDFEPEPGRRVAVNAIYPIVENESENTEAALIVRAKKGGAGMTGTQTAINAAGFCPVRGDGRFARARMVIPAGASWDKASGLQAEFRVSGKR